MKREDLRTQEDALLLESSFKRSRFSEVSRKRRKRRDDIPGRLYRYLKEMDR